MVERCRMEELSLNCGLRFAANPADGREVLRPLPPPKDQQRTQRQQRKAMVHLARGEAVDKKPPRAASHGSLTGLGGLGAAAHEGNVGATLWDSLPVAGQRVRPRPLRECPPGLGPPTPSPCSTPLASGSNDNVAPLDPLSVAAAVLSAAQAQEVPVHKVAAGHLGHLSGVSAAAILAAALQGLVPVRLMPAAAGPDDDEDTRLWLSEDLWAASAGMGAIGASEDGSGSSCQGGGSRSSSPGSCGSSESLDAGSDAVGPSRYRAAPASHHLYDAPSFTPSHQARRIDKAVKADKAQARTTPFSAYRAAVIAGEVSEPWAPSSACSPPARAVAAAAPRTQAPTPERRAPRAPFESPMAPPRIATLR